MGVATDQSYARELGDFLRSRRQRTTPEDLGLEPGPRRKVVARAARQPDVRVQRRPDRVPASTQRLLPLMGVPAVVLGRHLDVLAWNALAAELLGDPASLPPERRNFLTALFDDESGRLHCADWESTALDYIGMLRAAVAADPGHPRAVAVVGELSIRSPEFRGLWARHDVRESVHGAKVIHHPRVGDIAMEWDAYPLPGSPGPVMVVFTPQPGPADDKLRLLGTLAETWPADAEANPAVRQSC